MKTLTSISVIVATTISEMGYVSEITTSISQIGPQFSRLQPPRAYLLRRYGSVYQQICDLMASDVLAQRVTPEDPFSQTGTALGFGISGFLTVGLNSSEACFPPMHLKPVIRETNLAARVALAFLCIGFDRLQQVIKLHPGFHRRSDQAQTGSPVSDSVPGIGREDLLGFKIFNLLRRLAPARRWFMDGLGSTVNPVPRSPWTPYRVQAGRGSQ